MIKTYGQNQALDKNLHSILPPTTHLLGYAGYAISEQLMIPYPIKDDMIEFETRYNHHHSRTRIIVERAFGLLKGNGVFWKRRGI